MESLDSLLPASEPDATFHDASLRDARFEHSKRIASLVFDLQVGADAAAPRRGTLEIRGLHFWVLDPPWTPFSPTAGHWLTSDGPLAAAPGEVARRLRETAPSSAQGWYLFFSDLNAFAYFAADDVSFHWNQSDV